MCLRDFGCVREGCGFKRRNNICFPYDLLFQLVYVIFGNTLYLDCLEMAYIRSVGFVNKSNPRDAFDKILKYYIMSSILNNARIPARAVGSRINLGAEIV